MTLIAMCSAKGSPGVTVSALAFTLTWWRGVVLAECDPAGGDIGAGFLREVPLYGRGLAQLGALLRRRRRFEDLWAQLVDLAPDPDNALTRLVLPGLSDPSQARSWAEPDHPGQVCGWQQLAGLFAEVPRELLGYDVIADCGRLAAAHSPLPVLAAADVVLLVLRPQLPSVRAAAVALASLHQHGVGPVGLLVVGEGVYGAQECARELGAPLVVTLPSDPGTAGVLAHGGRYHRGRLLRGAAHAEAAVSQMAAVVASGATRRDGKGPAGQVSDVR